MAFFEIKKRKGQGIGIDYILGMALFVIAISIGIVYTSTSMRPTTPFSQRMESLTASAGSNLKSFAEWKVYKTPITIESDYSLNNEPVELNYTFDSSTDLNSTALLKSGSRITSWINLSKEKIVFISNLSSGSHNFTLIHARNTDLDSFEQSSNLQVSGNSVWNNKQNITFSSTGFSSLEYDGTQFLNETADFSESSSPEIEKQLLRSLTSYDSGKNFKMYERSDKIRITNISGSQTWNLNLSNYFTDLYSSKEDSVFSLDGNGTLYNSVSDWVDFYSSKGLSIIGNDLDFNVYKKFNGSRIEVEISVPSNTNKVLLFSHQGDYTNAQIQNNTFYNTYDRIIGPEMEKKGVRISKINEFSNKPYSSQKSTLGVEGVDFNLTISNLLHAGKQIPERREVVVLKYPIPLMGRLANYTLKNMRIAVWM